MISSSITRRPLYDADTIHYTSAHAHARSTRTCVLATFLALLFGLACANPERTIMNDSSKNSPNTMTSRDRRDISNEQTPRDELGLAFDEFVNTLRDVEKDIRQTESFGDEQERIGGYRHILRSIAKGMEAEVLQDPDFPYFRILDWWLREGGDNPDQRYAFTPIRGGENYRVWGQLGSATRVEFQIYAGRPWDGTGSSAGYLAFEDIELGEDGSFEVWVSADPRDGNWLANPVTGTTLFARHIYGDWNGEPTGDIHIDRIGYEGARRPPESANELAGRIRAAASMFGTTARTWPAFVERRYAGAREPNSVAPPYDTYALGGAKGRWMSGGYFKLDEGKALVVRMPQTSADYQALQLTDMWFASLEHGNQVSSLTTQQSVQAPDGAYWYVIANEDPGYANWLDAGAIRRGTFLLRWDGVEGELGENQFPSAELLSLDAITERIPGFEVMTPEARYETRRLRRQHLQLRSHR